MNVRARSSVDSLQICIISWAGQHLAAVRIAHALQASRARVCIVYSDPDPETLLAAPCQTMRTDNALFWADKFSRSLALAGEGDLLIIHADCDCDDWLALVSRCLAGFSLSPTVQMWAPEVRGADYPLKVTTLMEVGGTSMHVSVYVEGLVFAIRQGVVQRMRQLDFRANIYGWGIDAVMAAHIYAGGNMALVDSSIQVRHAPGRGYPSDQALKQMQGFMSQMSVPEVVMYKLQLSHIRYQLARRAQVETPGVSS